MCARFTVLNETPIAAAITGCVIPLSRSNTIWMRSRCDAGSFHRSAVFNFRIWLLVHLTICSPESDDHSESYCLLNRWQPATINPPIQSAVEVVLDIARDVPDRPGRAMTSAPRNGLERRNDASLTKQPRPGDVVQLRPSLSAAD